jgi:phenylacetate-coenzyme A ligase PaaK-like adenylate-forming protein
MGSRYLLTNLYNRAQPLIRYEVTDMLCRSPALCPCGRPFALLSSIGGRAEDMLRLPRADGREGTVTVTPMVIGLAVEAFIGVREYAVEHDGQGIRMRLVVPDEADCRRILDELPARIVSDLARHGAAAPPIAIEFIGQLPRSEQRMGKIAVVARRKATTA